MMGNLEENKRYLSYSLKHFLAVAIPRAFGLSLLSRPLLEILFTSEIAEQGYFRDKLGNDKWNEVLFITNVNATRVNSYDGDSLLQLIDKGLSNGQMISKVVAGGAYSSAVNLFGMLKRDAVLIAPVSKDANAFGDYDSQSKFIIDESGVTHPAGHRTIMSYHDQKKDTHLYHFKKSDCCECSLKTKCTKMNHRTITIVDIILFLKRLIDTVNLRILSMI
jgi:hypothetical protein